MGARILIGDVRDMRAEQLIHRQQLTRNELRRLIAARRQNGIRQDWLAQRLGLSPRAFDNYEAGIRRPPVSVVVAWQRVLHEAQQAPRRVA